MQQKRSEKHLNKLLMSMHHNPNDPNMVEQRRRHQQQNANVIAWINEIIEDREKWDKKNPKKGKRATHWENAKKVLEDIGAKQHITAQYVL